MLRRGSSGLTPHEVDAIRQEALQFAGIGLLTLGLDGSILYVDRVTLQLFGVEDRFPDVVSAVGLIADEVLGNREFLTSLSREAQLRGRVHGVERQIVTARGEPRWVICDAYSLPVFGQQFQAIQFMMRDVTARKEVQDRFRRFVGVVLGLGLDFGANVARLVAVAGQTLGAEGAAYSRMSQGRLLVVGAWGCLEGWEGKGGEGRICLEVMKQGSPEPVVVRNLPATPYATTDPLVVGVMAQTYVGIGVRREGEVVGVLALFFSRDVEPTQDDLTMLRLAAGALEREEALAMVHEALRDREEMYRSVVEQSMEQIFLVDPQTHRVLESNPALQRLLGYTAEELAGASLEDFVAHDASDIQEKVDTVLREGRGFLGERRYRRKDGSAVEVEVSACTVTVRGKPVLVAVARDVTDHHRALVRLRESEERYRSLVEHSLQGIAVVQGEEPRLVFGNQRLAQTLGCNLEELLRMSPDELRGLIHPDDREEGARAYRACLSGRGPVTLELRVVGRDGILRWVEMMLDSLTLSGQPSVQVAMVDITARKEMEERLSHSEAQYRLTLDALPQAIHVVDGQLRIVLINRRFRDWNEELGVSPEALGKTPFELYPFLPEKVREEYEYVLRRGVPLATEETVTIGERTFITQTTKIPVLEQGKVVRIVTVVDDVTERRHLEAQVRQSNKMEAIGQLAGGIAHDFNNLLAVIMGHASVLTRELPRSSRLAESARVIESTAERAAEFTKQLLWFARRGQPQFTQVDVHQCIREVVELLSRTLDPSIRLTLALEAKEHTVRGDPGQIHQVLLNLALNARDAMPSGGELRIGTRVEHLGEEHRLVHVEARPGPHLVLTVTDTGHGIPRESLPRIFEPFFTTKAHGSGMGLATVYGIVKSHGGHVEVSSEEGKGTTFEVFLPLLPVEGSQG